LELPDILIVEDDPIVRSLVEDTLAEGGFKVGQASSAEQAIELLDAQESQYRALVTDINLGSNTLTGWDVARHAREIAGDVAVVYMTGDSAADWTSQGVPNSILLTKPFAPAQLLTAVSQLLNAGTPPTV
jgi:DNA-binding response OmpR family regulator